MGLEIESTAGRGTWPLQGELGSFNDSQARRELDKFRRGAVEYLRSPLLYRETLQDHIDYADRLIEWAASSGPWKKTDLQSSNRSEMSIGARGLWFVRHLEFFQASMAFISGEETWAEAIFVRIADEPPQTIGQPLRYCGRHQLACLRALRGDQDGLRRLLDLIKEGQRDTASRCPATDYSVAEILRYFLNHDRPHPTATKMVKTLGINEVKDWRTAYKKAIGKLLPIVKKYGLAKSWEFESLSTDQPAPWETAPKPRECIQCGLLIVIGAQDVRHDFPFLEPAVYELQRRFHRQIEWAEKLSKESLDEAKEVLLQLGSEVEHRAKKSPEAFSGFSAEIKGRLEELERQIDQRTVREESLRDNELLEDLFKNVVSKDIAAAEIHRTKMQSQASIKWESVLKVNESRWRQRVEDTAWSEFNLAWPAIRQMLEKGLFEKAKIDAAKIDPQFYSLIDEFVRKRQASIAFASGLDLLEKDLHQAEVYFLEAVRLDEDRYAQTVPPLLVVSALFRSGQVRREKFLDVHEYVRNLNDQVAEGADSPLFDEQASSTVWDKLSSIVCQAAEFGTRSETEGRSTSEELVGHLEKSAKRNVGNERVLKALLNLLEQIRQRAPNQCRFGSPADELNHYIRSHLRVIRANQAGAEDANEELRQTISEFPENCDAWLWLAELLLNDAADQAHWNRRTKRRIYQTVQEKIKAAEAPLETWSENSVEVLNDMIQDAAQ